MISDARLHGYSCAGRLKFQRTRNEFLVSRVISGQREGGPRASIGRQRSTMPNTSKKCAHPSCRCQVTDDKYCSQLCKDAGGDEVEIACDCGHPACE
jgi:hypothetical protein